MQPNSWKQIEAIIDQIPLYQTVFTKEEARFLYELSFKTKGIGEIVEVGTNMGISAIALAFGQKKKAGRPIVSIDIWQHPDVENNLQLAGVSGYVMRIIGESINVASKWNKDIEFLWLDGDHSCLGTSADIIHWSKFVVTNGFVGVHDYPGLCKPVQRHLLSKPNEWRVLSDREASRIVVFQKLHYQPKSAPGPSRRLSNWFYWRYRDMRYFAFRYFPRTSSRIIQLIKKSN